MTWYQIWTVCWQIAVFLTPMLVGIAVLWLKSQFVTKVDATAERNRVDAEFKRLGDKVAAETTRVDTTFKTERDQRDQRYELIRDKLADHEGRLAASEKEIGRPPTRHALNNELTKVVAAVAGLERTMSGFGKQIDTVHTYLHTLVERGMDGK